MLIAVANGSPYDREAAAIPGNWVSLQFLAGMNCGAGRCLVFDHDIDQDLLRHNNVQVLALACKITSIAISLQSASMLTAMFI